MLNFFINVLPECCHFAPKKHQLFPTGRGLQRHEFQRGMDTDPVSAAANVGEFLAVRIGHQKCRTKFDGKVRQSHMFDGRIRVTEVLCFFRRSPGGTGGCMRNLVHGKTKR